jgi:serine/threonine-protein kinase
MTSQTLGRYQIIGELGRGAMGTVYHGIDPTIERPVALKTLNPDLPGEILEEVKGRFLREAKSAGKLNHPNIVTIYEFGESEGTAFIAMEYLEGRSLHEVMRGERLPFSTIASIIAQIADGLDYAHRFGVVHRDIKPANIMVSPHAVAKLTDFGIAHIQSSTMTTAGTMLGSPKYMAPEHVLGKAIDGRADIFSLGIVLYEMLARRTPFEEGESSTIFSLMQRIVTEPQPMLAEIAPDVPQAFDLILSRALAKKPDERYQRANQFANDLRNFKTLLSANGTQDLDITAIVNRPAYAEPAPDEPTQILPRPSMKITPPAGAQPAPAPTAATAPVPEAPAAPAGGGSAWERAAAFLGRKTGFAGATAPAKAPAAPAASTPAAPVAVSAPVVAAAPVVAMSPTAAAPASTQAAAQPAPAAAPQPPSRFAGSQPQPPSSTELLLGDLDSLSSSLEEAQRKFIEEEATAMAALRKGAPRAKDWDNIVSGIDPNGTLAGEMETTGGKALPGGAAASSTGAVRSSGVFGLLRQQASSDLKSQAMARRNAEAQAILDLDARFRAGYQFLLEFCREINEATPVYAGKHDLLFYGPCPTMFFHEATVNARMNRLDDRGKLKDVLDHVILSYYLTSPETGRAAITPVELPKFKELLAAHEMKHDVQEVKNDFKQVIRAKVDFEFKFICSLTARANYTEQSIDITCRNIGPLGRTRYVVPAAELDVSFFEELSKLMLGFPSEASRYAVAV